MLPKVMASASARPRSIGARAMGSRWLARIYERWWRPVTFAWGAGFRMPGTDEEVAVVLGKLEEMPGPWLDLSCGPGNITRRLVARAAGRAVVALDRSPAMLERVKVNAPQATRVCADAAELPFEDETFGAIVNLAALDLYADAARVLAESARVLVPGGRWIASSFVRLSSSDASGSRARRIAHRTWERLAGVRTPTEADLARYACDAGLARFQSLRFGRYVIAWADKP